MEWYKLFCNGWFKREIDDQRILFREYLRKEWWNTLSDEEKRKWYDKESRKISFIQNAKQGLILESILSMYSYYD